MVAGTRKTHRGHTVHQTRHLMPGLLLLLTAAGCPSTDQPWRSRLYPEDWTPAYTDAEGGFLHDFSYAVYHNGVAEPPRATGPVFDAVADFGADATGAADATSAIQWAIDAAANAGGGVVHLPAGLYRCDGMLTISASGIVLRGDGAAATRVYFTQGRGMSNKSHIIFRGALKREVDIALLADGENRALTVQVVDAGDLAVGDEVSVGWVITDAFVAEHGMTGTWQAFNGQWKPVFRRTITAVDRSKRPHQVTFDVPLRYGAKMRDEASLRRESGYLAECGIEELAIANAVDWDAAWDEVRVHAITFQAVKDCWVRGVESFPTPLAGAKRYHLQSGGLKIIDAKRVTVADCRMAYAQNRGGGGCGYLFEVSRSNEILTRDCTAENGRHNFIQNWDFGTAGCVWLRCSSKGSRNVQGRHDPIGLPAYCEYHHSLAMACLVDSCTFTDGWYGGNRRHWSSGAGHSVTQSVYWNTRGGRLRSCQYGLGYVIGTTDVTVRTTLFGPTAKGTEPQDYAEGCGRGQGLVPQSLYEDQLARRR